MPIDEEVQDTSGSAATTAAFDMDREFLAKEDISPSEQHIRAPDGFYYCQHSKCEDRKGFHLPSNLTKHMNTHTKPYDCGYCHMSMATPRDIQKHEDTHRQRRTTYQCPKCDEAPTFTRTDSRLRHMRKAHPELYDAKGNLKKPYPSEP